ncbi:hypothetical protein [Wolbachia endosymbiont (group A) of Anomoia purmunda]|uniref:hypothetical protein n=1 Tax=Wolbachia endosymbiont (group A) of Anomoia purmunda TaxID=2953978 RepID=UPI00222F7565|nr:hypothetical protein [Wolbachia endosymbiont (group A) of Anomoia purmunda]
MSGVYKNFKKYAQYRAVSDDSQVLQNCFYKSVYYIDSVVGPVKDALFGVEESFSSHISLGGRGHRDSGMTSDAVSGLTNIVLQSLYLAFAYLSYWPAKGLAKVTDKFDLKDNTGSLIDYSKTFSDKAREHSWKVGKFVNTVLSYVCTAVIWAAALVITPLTWAVDKVSSKFSDAKSEAVNPNAIDSTK